VPGFNAQLSLAPDDGVGVVALTNGSRGAFVWLRVELAALLGELLGVPAEAVPVGVPHHPEIWGDLCGRYRLPAGVSDLRGRLLLAGGAEVLVRGGRLWARVLSPVPALFRGFPLLPDSEHDPDVFRLDLSGFGMGTARVVFARDPGGRVTAAHTDLQSLSLYRRGSPEMR
jgi:hypothetical protein